MRNNCQTPGLSVIAKTRMGARYTKEIRLFAGTLRDRRLIGERESAREVDYAERTHQSLKIEGFGGFAHSRLSQFQRQSRFGGPTHHVRRGRAPRP